MSGIGKSDLPSRQATSIAAFSYPPDHPAMAVWVQGSGGLLHRLKTDLQDRGAHPARTVVLLPYAQLRPLANRLWAQTYPDGFAPRFETSMSWSAGLGVQPLDASDIHFDAAMDSLTAHDLLVRAGLAAHAGALSERLVQCAQQLGTLASCMAPWERQSWAQAARQSFSVEMAAQPLQWEAAVARIALEWAAASAYQSDVMFAASTVASLDALLVVQGLQPDPLVAGLQRVWGSKLGVLAMPLPSGGAGMVAREGLGLHPCADAHDEAQRTAACVLRHIEAGRIPLALVSSDRALTRRVRAMLESAQVQMRDENGWKLSTSAAAAALMALLKASVWNASSDAVLAWLKQVPAFTTELSALEAALRREQLGQWRDADAHPRIQECAPLRAACTNIDALRSTLYGRHTLLEWLQSLRAALQSSGQWDALLADGAGVQVLSALRLEDGAFFALNSLAGDAAWSKRRMDLAEFTAWVNQTLEGAHFQPAYPQREEVVILPMSQMLGRPFAALVMAGCDEVRLSPSPEPPGTWTVAQRAVLGLPTRTALEHATRAAWYSALQTPVCDVLWRTGDEAGETLLPSALVQVLQLDAAASVASDPRALRRVAAMPVLPPLPRGAALPIRILSQSAYEDLRQCPYRFFAMRQLGLAQVEELESELGKRDFGNWLHEVLKRFHEQLSADRISDVEQWLPVMEAASRKATEALALPEGDFLPFAASWPRTRDGYLEWLGSHVAQGFAFSSAETPHRQPIGGLVLQGRIDRIDKAADASAFVLDYKTENPAKTTARVKNMFEDTQMAFYAALLPDDSLRAAYVNVGENDTRLVEQIHVVQARDALLEGIVSDMQGIAAGTPLPALGEGDACEFCHARGLCRKDFWSTP